MSDDIIEKSSILLGGYNGYPLEEEEYNFETVILVREKLRQGLTSEEISEELKIPNNHIVLMGIGMINILHHTKIGKIFFSKNPIPEVI